MPQPLLTDPAYLERLLQRERISPNARAGQNFLVCAEVVEAIVAALQDGPQLVTELGAGLGTLTQGLIANGFSVRAIERDSALAPLIAKHMPPKMRLRLNTVVDDLKHADWSYEEPYQLVGNIPYNLSGLIIRHLTALTPPPTRVVLLVQHEVGERLTATVPDMQLLSAVVQLWGTATSLLTVPANCFVPAPKVRSMVVSLEPHSTQLPSAEREVIVATAKTFFQQRRKQVGGVLRRQYQLSDSALAALCTIVGVAPESRPQELTVEQWRALAAELPNRP